MDKTDGDFGDVITGYQQCHTPQGCAQPDTQKGQRHTHQPHRSGIQQAGEQGVAAGAENTYHQRHAVGLDRTHERLQNHQRSCHSQRFRRNLIQGKKQRMDDDDNQTGTQTDHRQQNGKAVAVIQCLLLVARAHSTTHKNAAGVAQTTGKDKQKLDGGVGNLHSRQCFGTQQAVGHRVQRDAGAPQNLVEQNRPGRLDIFGNKAFVKGKELFDLCRTGQLLLIDDEHQKQTLGCAGDGGGDGSTVQTQGREAAQTENQQRVAHHIDADGQHGGTGGDGNIAGAPAHHGQNHAQRRHRIADAHDAQVGGAHGQGRLLVYIKAHQKPGRQQRTQGEQGDSHRSQKVHHTHGAADIFQIPGAPELGQEHRRARIDAEQHQVEQKEDLVGAARGGNGTVAQ